MPDLTKHTPVKNFKEPLVTGFLKCVSEYPDKNALWINNTYYSYGQLAQIVLSIYHKIPTGNTYEKIGIYCSDDIYTYASILAVSLYGAAYVPLNNKFPVIRNRVIVEQCDLKLILSSSDNLELRGLSDKAEIILSLFGQGEKFYNIREEIPLCTRKDKWKSDVAYILFTSGSTGEPKGVPVSNSNVNHCFDFFLKNFDFNSNDRFLQTYELTFDVSVFSFFMPLLVGACCYVPSGEGVKFMKIIQMLKDHRITVLSMVPGILQYMEKYLPEVKLGDLRYSFFSGDALYHQLAVKWKATVPNAQIHNFYGPTETTIVCTHYPWDEMRSSKGSVNGIVPLGKPFPGMKPLIVDEENQPVVKGELCFTGEQVISEYLNNSNTTKFFDNKGERYYKTGDIVSCNENGDMVFYGRTDNQVKINGYRIELGEIEFAIERITNTKCTVLCLKDQKEMNKLVAFIQTSSLDEKQLMEKLLLLLPDYMLPRQYIAMDKFPLNINGKVDKNKLLNLQE